jgi:hypothetical protein
MLIHFTYDEDKDVECLITKGGGSNNSPGQKTKTYEALLAYTNEVANIEKVREFVRFHIKDNDLNIEEVKASLQRNWDMISMDFEKRTEKVFGVSIADNITAYLTITGRFPYSIEKKYFYVSAKKSNANATAMHELWHFYTWHKFGDTINQIGPEKFNDIKEALTILLNIEYPDLLNGEIDNGYPQHQELRKLISDTWSKTKDINKVWEMALEA